MKNMLTAATTASRSRWGGLILATVAVGGALAARFLLEGLGHFYYLPMLPAVIITALLARRSAVALAVAHEHQGGILAAQGFNICRDGLDELLRVLL